MQISVEGDGIGNLEDVDFNYVKRQTEKEGLT